MSFDVDEFLDIYERPRKLVPICPRAGLLVEFSELEAEILQAQTRDSLGGPPSELMERLKAIEDEIEQSVRVFTLEARTTREWSDLLAAHPPTKDQAKDGHIANPDTFGPAALAACAVDPVVTVEQAVRMRETLPPSEWEALTGALSALHRERVTSPKSLLLSVVRRMSDASSTMPLSAGSLAASFSDADGGQ